MESSSMFLPNRSGADASVAARSLYERFGFVGPPNAVIARRLTGLGVNANQRTTRRSLRVEITGESVFRSDLHMPGRAARPIDQHCAQWGFVRIAHRQLLESVVAHELVAGLLRHGRFRVGSHRTRGKQSFFHIAPASRSRTGVGTFIGDGSGASQFGIETRIHFCKRRHDPVFSKMVDDRRGGHLPCRIFVNEARLRRGQNCRLHGRRRNRGTAAAQESKQEKSSHSRPLPVIGASCNSFLSFELTFAATARLALGGDHFDHPPTQLLVGKPTGACLHVVFQMPRVAGCWNRAGDSPVRNDPFEEELRP
jgi:hypothetical protein